MDLTWTSGADAWVHRLANERRRTVPVGRTMKFASKLLAHYFLEEAHILSANSPWSPLLICQISVKSDIIFILTFLSKWTLPGLAGPMLEYTDWHKTDGGQYLWGERWSLQVNNSLIISWKKLIFCQQIAPGLLTWLVKSQGNQTLSSYWNFEASWPYLD